MKTENQNLDSEWLLICIEPNCLFKTIILTEDSVCPVCASIAIIINRQELLAAPNGADVMEYINEQMGS